MDWSHVDFLWNYCDVLISSLISHSDGTHSLQSIIGEQGGYIFSKTIPLINMAKRHNQACVNNLPLISFHLFIYFCSNE